MDLKTYTRISVNSFPFCIDTEAGYEMLGNLEYASATNFAIDISRCKISATQTCKSDSEIDAFIDVLIVNQI